jgi:adenosylcobinamide-GDP ribazoletransferase
MIKQFLAAVQFLTICPLPASIKIDEQMLGRSVTYFPVVGILLGAAAACLDYGLTYILPLPVVSTLVVIFMIAVSGALHMDGLADTADGFFSSRPRRQMLDIMRDSRTGPMGVIAIVCVLILKITLLTSVPQSAHWWVLLLTPFAGRSALLVMMAVIPYARKEEGGLAAIFYTHRSRYYLIWVMIALATIGWLVSGWAGLTAGLASFVFGLLLTAYVHTKIGGFTGDTLGAACELTELIPPMVCVIWAHRCLSVI